MWGANKIAKCTKERDKVESAKGRAPENGVVCVAKLVAFVGESRRVSRAKLIAHKVEKK